MPRDVANTWPGELNELYPLELECEPMGKVRFVIPRVRAWFGRSAWFGILPLIALGGLYYTTRPCIHTFDAVSYMWNVETKPFAALFHPHHLLYAPLGRLAYEFAQQSGYTGHADLPIQVLNAIGGSLGLIFFWRFGTRWTGRPWVSLGVALTIGLCYAYWLYAGEVEVYTWAAAFLSLAIWILVMVDEQPLPLGAVALGAAHAGAVMFHQTNVLLAIPLLLFLVLRTNLRRFSILLAYASAFVFLVLIAYGAVIYQSGFTSWQDVYNWLTAYAQTGRWGGYLGSTHLPALWAGLRITVSHDLWPALLFYGMALGGLVLSAVYSRDNVRVRHWLLFGLMWFVTYGGFFWWWEPWNVEFWIAVLPLMGLWGLLFWPAVAPAQDNERSVRSVIFGAAFGLYVVVLAGWLFIANRGSIGQFSDPSNDHYYSMIGAAEETLQPSDLVVTRGNILDLYLPFYADHTMLLSMRELDYEFSGDRGQVMVELVSRFDWAIATGQALVIDHLLLDEPRSADRNPFGLLPGEIAELRTRYDLNPVVLLNEVPVFYGTPRFDQPSATFWVFSQSLQGWNVWGVDQPRFQDDGWCFTGGHDPQFKGPPIQLDATTWTRLEVELALDADQSIMEVYWRTLESDYSLANSVKVTLEHGRQVYPIKLSGAPGWAGTIVQLRIDPIPGADAGERPVTTCMYSVRLLDDFQ